MDDTTRSEEKKTPAKALHYDVVIVGAGPAGLAAAIYIKQIAKDNRQNISVCVLEKSTVAGAHILSGAVFDTSALADLIPDWKEKEAPIHTPVLESNAMLLTPKSYVEIPKPFLPQNLRHDDSYLVNLSELVRWLAEEAKDYGVHVLTQHAATEILYSQNKQVVGVTASLLSQERTAANNPKIIQIDFYGRYTLFAEGSRGQLGRELINKFRLDRSSDPQAYALGIKELWQVPSSKHRTGTVIHTSGWPLSEETYGNGFIYHMGNNLIAVGHIIGLDYSNPRLSPFEEMQRWKAHPVVRGCLEGGQRIGYGARTLTIGGILSLPRFTFPGGALIGCDAGFLDPGSIKGSHGAIKSGMLAAESIAQALTDGRMHDQLSDMQTDFEDSWLYRDLQQSRNSKQWFRIKKGGRVLGSIMSSVEQYILPKVFVNSPPWTIHRKKQDHLCLRPAAECPSIKYPAPDGVLTFDIKSSIALCRIQQEAIPPVKIELRDHDSARKINLKIYRGPEEKYCPAGVFSYVRDSKEKKQLQIQESHCIHCKACDIKDPTQNIVWKAVHGGGGPDFMGM